MGTGNLSFHADVDAFDNNEAFVRVRYNNELVGWLYKEHIQLRPGNWPPERFKMIHTAWEMWKTTNFSESFHVILAD